MSRWYQVVVKGKLGEIAHFLDKAGPGLAGQVIRGSAVHLEPESLAERLRDLLGADSHHLLFASQETARTLLAALAGHAFLEIDQIQEIVSGRFAFRIEAYSEQQRKDIRLACLAEIPGVRLVGLEESVRRDPSAKGPEMFRPGPRIRLPGRGGDGGHGAGDPRSLPPGGRAGLRPSQVARLAEPRRAAGGPRLRRLTGSPSAPAPPGCRRAGSSGSAGGWSRRRGRRRSRCRGGSGRGRSRRLAAVGPSRPSAAVSRSRSCRRGRCAAGG